MSYPSHISWVGHFNNIWREVHIMKFPVIKCCPDSYYSISLRSKYCRQHPVLKHSQIIYLPYCERLSSTPIQNCRLRYSSAYYVVPSIARKSASSKWPNNFNFLNEYYRLVNKLKVFISTPNIKNQILWLIRNHLSIYIYIFTYPTCNTYYFRTREKSIKYFLWLQIITFAEMSSMRRTVKYAWFHYRRNEHILEDPKAELIKNKILVFKVYTLHP
jgi:hypothetical protein